MFCVFGSDRCYPFESAAIVDVLKASNNDVKVVETRNEYFALLMLSSQLERINKLYRDFSFLHCLYPVNPHALTKTAGTVNEVYCLILYIPRDISLFKSPPASWQKVNVSPVCFGAKNNRFGRFHLPACRLAALVRLYSYVSCYNPVDTWWSYWGCGENPRDELKNQVNVITTSANQIILPPKQFLNTKKLEKLKWHKIPGFNSLSTELVLSVMSMPYWIPSSHELRLWYGEDLVNSSEKDNGGTVCADIYALFV